MTSTNTLPILRPTTTTPLHEHAWLTESRHRTSEGAILYVRCGSCAARRVDLQPSSSVPPTALSRDVGAGAGSRED